jgi:uncharacterized protein (TIRG00374 family)
MTAKRCFGTALKLGISLTLMFLLYRRIEIGKLAAILGQMNFLMLVPLFILLFFNTFISSVKWHVLLRADDIDVPLRSLVGSYLIGSFFNVFLPSNIGGDVYRIVDVARRSSKPVNTFASVFVDRLSGFFALAIMGFVFPAAGYLLLPGGRILILPLAVFALITVMILLLYQQGIVRALMQWFRLDRAPRMRNFVEQFLGSITAYKRKQNVVAKVMGVSFLFQFSVIVCIYLMAVAIDIRIPLAFFFLFVPLVLLMEALPVSIYGLGLRDAGYLFFFTQVGRGRPVEEAASMSLLYVTVTLVYASLGGIVFAARRRIRQ